MTKERLMRIAAARRHAKDGTGKAIRNAAGITLPEMAQALGCNKSSLWRWEEGISMPRGDAGARWVDLLEELQRTTTTANAA